MLLFFDIDGTLINFENEIREKTVEAILTAKANGHKCFINSGRSRAFIQNKELLDIGFDGIVSSCGCMIEYEGNVIFNHTVSAEDAQRTVETVKRFRIKPMYEGKDHIYLTKTDFTGDFVADRLIKEVGFRLKDTDEYRGKWEFQKLVCVTEIPLSEREEFFRELSDIYGFIIHSDRVTEAVPRGFDKGSGIRMVCELLGEDIENTFAFGDGINDREMLLAAGCGVGMAGSRCDMTPFSDYITAPLEEDGIWKAMKHFELI